MKHRHSGEYRNLHFYMGYYTYGEVSGCTEACVFITSFSGAPMPARIRIEATVDGITWTEILPSTLISILSPYYLIPNAGCYQAVRVKTTGSFSSFIFASYWR